MQDLLSLDLPFTTLAIAVFAIFAIMAFARGIVRQIWGMVCLAAGAGTGYLIFSHGGRWLNPIIEHPTGDTVLGASILGGVVVWLGGKGIVRAVYRNLSGATTVPRSMTGRLVGAGFSLIPAAFLVWVAATALRLTGTVTEMGRIDDAIEAVGGAPVEAPSFLTNLRRQLDSGWLGEILKKTDPITSEAGHQLASLLVLYRDSEAWARLKQTHPEVARLLDNAKLQRVLDDREVRNSVAFSDHAALLLRPEIRDAASDPALARELNGIDVREWIESALFEPAPEEPHQKKRRFLRRLTNRRE